MYETDKVPLEEMYEIPEELLKNVSGGAGPNPGGCGPTSPRDCTLPGQN